MAYIVQQFEWGFRTYNTETEEPVDGAIAEFTPTDEQAEIINTPGSIIEVVNGKLKVSVDEDVLYPLFEQEAQRREEKGEQELRAYEEWLQTPEGKVAARYLYYQRHGEWPPEEAS